MKLKRTSFVVLLLLPLAVSVAAMWFLPEIIPVHFGVAGEATRWAGRAAVLVVPSLSVSGGLVMGLLSKRAKTPQSRKIWFWGAVAVMLVFLCVTVWYLCKAVAII